MGSPVHASKRVTFAEGDSHKLGQPHEPPPPPPPPPPMSTTLGPLDEPVSATEMSLAQIRASAAVLAGLLDESKDEQVLKETCLGLCQLFGEGIQNDRIQSILEADVVPRLVELLRPIAGKNGTVSFRIPLSIQSAALQVIGNIACGDDRQTQVIIDANALPCLKSLLSSGERGIRKECCWIVSNITESAHQVQDVIDAGILPPLIRLLESGDAACREDATWVLYNVTANRDVSQIQYLAENNGIRALCGLLACTKELDVFWKGCGTVSAVALKGIRNILVIGEDSPKQESSRNRFAASVAEAHGVERIEMLTAHRSSDVQQRAQAILRAFFGSEGPTMTCARDSSNVSGNSCSSICSQIGNTGGTCEECDCPSVSTESASSDTDVDEEDSDLELIPPSPPECQCVLCLDPSPLPDKRSRNPIDTRQDEICRFCSSNSQIGNTKAGLASKMGRAVRMGHTHCLALVLSQMSWNQRGAATDIPAPLNPTVKGTAGGGTPDPALTTTLPAVVLAAQLGKPGCLQLLISKCQPELDQTHGKKRLTPLAWAANKGNLRCCAILLKMGASAGARCADGWTALHLAASGAGSTAVCRLLLDYAAPVNSLSAKNQTPLCLAAQKGHTKVARLLLENGADFKNEDDQKFTPLHLAALQGHEDIAKALIDAGALLDAKTTSGVTALHYAVQGRHLNCVTLLLGAGAKIDGNSPGNSLLLIAADDGEPECVRALLNASAPPDCRANIRVQINKDYEVMDYLAPLHLAASKGHREVVELLIANGAPVDDRSNKGWSALDFAVLNGHASCALVLLGCGARVDEHAKVCGRGGWTLVQHAAHSGSRDLVRLLVVRLKEQEQEANGNGFDIVQPVRRETVVGTEVDTGGHHSPGNESAKTSAQGSSRRKREVREFEKDTQKDRDERRRELEALEARDRLQEAMSQKSAAKLTDSIAQVNKIILQQATGAGGISGKSTPPRDIAAELHLGIEVEKARKILSGVQSDQRRAKELKAAAVADAKRESARKLVYDACMATLRGGDPRVLTKTSNRAKKSGLEPSDIIFDRVTIANEIIQRTEQLSTKLANAEKDKNLLQLRQCKQQLVAFNNELHEYGGGLIERIVGRRYSVLIEDTDTLIESLAEEEEEKQSAARKARQYEAEVIDELRKSSESSSLKQVEKAIERASEYQASEEVAAELQAVRKSFQKSCKAERKKIRQAASSSDIEVVEAVMDEAKKLNLNALVTDVAALQTSLDILVRREEALDKMTRGAATKDVVLLSEARAILVELGMFGEGEKARGMVDALQRQTRLRSQLDAAMREGHEFLSKYEDHDDITLLQEWVWPDAKRLADLVRRTEAQGSVGLDDYLKSAKEIAVKYSELGRRVLLVAGKANDSRTIGAAIDSYRKAFMLEGGSVALLEFDLSRSNGALAAAGKRLAEVQARDQKSILEESVLAKDRAQAEMKARESVLESNAIEMAGCRQPEKSLGVEGEFGEEGASCFHYYKWKEGSVVQCSRCGNRRLSDNPEWLDRVKRRAAGDSLSREPHQKDVFTDKKPRSSDSSFPSRRESGATSQRNITTSRNLEVFGNGMGLQAQSRTSFGGMRSVMLPSGSQPVIGSSVTSTGTTYPVGHSESSLFSLPGNSVSNLNSEEAVRYPPESSSDLTVEGFANENFGFDIDSIVDDSGK